MTQLKCTKVIKVRNNNYFYIDFIFFIFTQNIWCNKQKYRESAFIMHTVLNLIGKMSGESHIFLKTLYFNIHLPTVWQSFFYSFSWRPFISTTLRRLFQLQVSSPRQKHALLWLTHCRYKVIHDQGSGISSFWSYPHDFSSSIRKDLAEIWT